MVRKRPFDISKIKITDNPFANKRATYIPTGVFIRDTEIEGKIFTPNLKPVIKTGLIKKLEEYYEEVVKTSEPKDLIILADFGQGKSFAFRYIQEKIITKHSDPLISISISEHATEILSNNTFFIELIINKLKVAFDNIDEEGYPEKNSLKETLNLDSENKPEYLLEILNKAFKILKIRVYIFIDELDKIIVKRDYSIENKRVFLGWLKAISEIGQDSFSVWLAGSKTCQALIVRQIGQDYLERFENIPSYSLTIDETKYYIEQKCLEVIDYKGEIPFDNYTIKAVHYLTDGKIRYIEGLCRNLWNYSVRKQSQINKILFKQYMKTELIEPTKGVLGNDIDSDIISIIIEFIIEGKMSLTKVFQGFSNRKKAKIREYIESTNVIRPIDRSYNIDEIYKDRILKEFLGIVEE